MREDLNKGHRRDRGLRKSKQTTVIRNEFHYFYVLYDVLGSFMHILIYPDIKGERYILI